MSSRALFGRGTESRPEASPERAWETEVPPDLLKRLRDRAPGIRRAAVEGLADYGPAAVEPLGHALRDRDRGVRAAAVRALARDSTGPEGVDLLCRALRDRTIRDEAIAALGEVGDERAIQPLTQALQRAFVGRSARSNLTFSFLAALSLAVFFAHLLTTLVATDMTAVQLGVGFLWLTYLLASERRKAQSENSRQIAGALEKIAERSPSPRFHSVVRELKLVSADPIQQETQAREVTWRAAERIERLTADLRSLPTPSSAPAVDTAALPRAAQETDPGPANLPVAQG